MVTVIRRGEPIRNSSGKIIGYKRGQSIEVKTDSSRRQIIDVATGKAYNRTTRTTVNGRTVIEGKTTEALKKEINTERAIQNELIKKRQEKENKAQVLQSQQIMSVLPPVQNQSYDTRNQTLDPRFTSEGINNFQLSNPKPFNYQIQNTRNAFDVDYEAYSKQKTGFIGQGTKTTFSPEITTTYDLRNPKEITYKNFAEIPKAKNYDDYLNRYLPDVQKTKFANASPIGKVFTFTVGAGVIGGMKGVVNVFNPKTYTRDLPQALKGIPTGETFMNVGTAFVTNPVGTTSELYTGAKVYGGIGRVIPRPSYLRNTVEYGKGEITMGKSVNGITDIKGFQDFTIKQKNIFGKQKEVGYGSVDYLGISRGTETVSRTQTTGTIATKFKGKQVNKIFVEDSLSSQQKSINAQISKIEIKDLSKGTSETSYSAGFSSSKLNDAGFRISFGINAQSGKPNIGASLVQEVMKVPEGTLSTVKSISIAEAFKNINPIKIRTPKGRIVKTYLDPASPVLDFFQVKKAPPMYNIKAPPMYNILPSNIPKSALFPTPAKLPFAEVSSGLSIKVPETQNPASIIRVGNIPITENKKVSSLSYTQEVINTNIQEINKISDTSSRSDTARISGNKITLISSTTQTPALAPPILRPQFRIPPPILKIPTITRPQTRIAPFMFPERKSSGLKNNNFSAFVKVKGKWLNIGSGLSKGKAIDLSTNFVTRRSSASFKILKGGSPVTNLNLGSMFKRSKSDTGAFIEKNKFRINFGQEVQEITHSRNKKKKVKKKKKGGKK